MPVVVGREEHCDGHLHIGANLMEDCYVTRMTPQQDNVDKIGSVLVVGSGIGGCKPPLILPIVVLWFIW